jgi:hypothetical protein
MAARERVQQLQIDVKLGGQKVDSAKKHTLWVMGRSSNNSGSNSNRVTASAGADMLSWLCYMFTRENPRATKRDRGCTT